jgi:hypothetical protein
MSGVPSDTTPSTTQGTPDQRGLPPVTEVAVTIIALVVTGGIYLAAYLPRRAPLGPAYGLLGVAAALLVWNVITISRLSAFAWATFFLVAKWALVAYLIIAGMLEYVFVFDHTRGSVLVVLTLILAIFAVNIPLLLAFSVARYQSPDTEG